jgi:hypothetical protein
MSAPGDFDAPFCNDVRPLNLKSREEQCRLSRRTVIIYGCVYDVGFALSLSGIRGSLVNADATQMVTLGAGAKTIPVPRAS